jgi:Rrf2 family transcriptional regulator, cysteine metabolism repressor
VLRFTKRVDYGLVAMQYVAFHQGVSPVAVKQIAEEFNIPVELLAKILQRLAKRGLIASHNGPKGGYRLAHQPEEITVGQVVRALEGPITIVSCYNDDSDCPQKPRCTLRRPVRKIQAAIGQLLDTMSLAELMGEDVPELLSVKG